MRASAPMGHGYFVIKILLWFLAALVPSVCLADTINAPRDFLVVGSYYASPVAACTAYAASNGGTFLEVTSLISDSYVRCTYSQPPYQATQNISYLYHCPDGGQVNGLAIPPSCQVAPCVPPLVRDELDGQCKEPPPPACVAGQAGSESIFGGWSIGPGKDAVLGNPTYPTSFCDGTCVVSISNVSSCGADPGSTVDNPKSIFCNADVVKTGASCSARNAPAMTPAPVIPKHPPKCDPSEGVMTSSSGTVACVPSGTPSAKPPVVLKQSGTENFPDGSAKTTEITTTRDPATGAENKITTITNTPATGGGDGQAGKAGTTNGVSEKAPSSGTSDKPGEASDFCVKNPTMQICKGGMSEEKTQKEIKDLLDPQDAANTESIAGEKNVFEEKATAHKEFIDAFASKGQSDEGFMSWAWIPEVPSSSCVPFTGTLAGRAISMDWCEQLGMVRDVAGYMFYILTAFGLFRIFANSTGATS